ncbi:MAG: hypothetical protein GY904_31250 [Planctomycetaceae bacterium]|nr:hypothetical protein [Planctomycetaceae bacterium]
MFFRRSLPRFGPAQCEGDELLDELNLAVLTAVLMQISQAIRSLLQRDGPSRLGTSASFGTVILGLGFVTLLTPLLNPRYSAVFDSVV